MKSLLLVLFLSVAALPAAAGDLTGQATVIDGDTLEIHGQRIRMVGIDAPESRQLCTGPGGVEYRCGRDAAFALAERIGRGTVICNGKEHDRYKRLLAVCSAGGTDLSAWMVEQGYAVAYRRYSTAYVDEEDRARTEARRLWAGRFEMPWDWRKQHS
jgi:endonuclease YncB( thermonuclease family)